MKRLIRFSVYCGRQGDLSGLFVYEDEEWDTLQEAIKEDRSMFFYEVLGKHSQVTVTCAEEDIFKIESEDQDFLDKLVDLLGYHISGCNPLDYLQEE